MQKETYVYIIRYGFNYERDNIFGVYTSRYKAKKAIEKHTQKDYLLHYYKESKNGYIEIFQSVLS